MLIISITQTYSGDPRTQHCNKDDTTPPEYEEHIYDAIRGPSEFQNEKEQQLEANNNPLYNSYCNAPRISSNDDDADRVSIKSDDVKYEDPEGQCKSSVKESKVYYSKNGKTKPQPKPRHSRKPTTTPVATAAAATAAVHYDVPANDRHPPPIDEGDYTALDVTHISVINDGNRFPPLGYSVPSNIPATT